MSVLSLYSVAPAFEVIQEIEIKCSRYDTLYNEGEVPQPDVIKIDVQGAELDILQGFGALLTKCLGIELETHVYPIYQGQALAGEIITYLDRYGFSLRKLACQMNFDSEAVEFDAYFTKRSENLSQCALEKLETINRVWNLQTSESGKKIAAIALST